VCHFLLLILIVSWVLSVSSVKVLCPIVVHQCSCYHSRQYIEHLIKESPDNVGKPMSEYACKRPLLEGRERVCDNMLDMDAKGTKGFSHLVSGGLSLNASLEEREDKVSSTKPMSSIEFTVD